jgi:hypothetical protein
MTVGSAPALRLHAKANYAQSSRIVGDVTLEVAEGRLKLTGRQAGRVGPARTVMWVLFGGSLVALLLVAVLAGADAPAEVGMPVVGISLALAFMGLIASIVVKVTENSRAHPVVLECPLSQVSNIKQGIDSNLGCLLWLLLTVVAAVIYWVVAGKNVLRFTAPFGKDGRMVQVMLKAPSAELSGFTGLFANAVASSGMVPAYAPQPLVAPQPAAPVVAPPVAPQPVPPPVAETVASPPVAPPVAETVASPPVAPPVSTPAARPHFYLFGVTSGMADECFGLLRRQLLPMPNEQVSLVRLIRLRDRGVGNPAVAAEVYELGSAETTHVTDAEALIRGVHGFSVERGAPAMLIVGSPPVADLLRSIRDDFNRQAMAHGVLPLFTLARTDSPETAEVLLTQYYDTGESDAEWERRYAMGHAGEPGSPA